MGKISILYRKIRYVVSESAARFSTIFSFSLRSSLFSSTFITFTNTHTVNIYVTIGQFT